MDGLTQSVPRLRRAVTKFDEEGRRVYSELKEANDGSLKPRLLKDIESMPDLAALIAATDEASIYVGRQVCIAKTRLNLGQHGFDSF